MRALLLALLLALAAPAFAQVSSNVGPLQFRDNAEEARFNRLAHELRCVMCQNQSLADSNAEIARDLRAEVLSLMRQGKSDDEVKAFLVQRYGEFVLYRPQVSSSTWLLWFGPGLLLLGGAVVLVLIVRRRSQTRPAALPGNDEPEDW
ncbi:MAG: cytochrome c-type biogenesis protein CcmH [Pseudoxanthomonas suwonensis]|nr:cytochrome c-type biogenesis protein CcmH [Pseudoxanthomonas suwonensis]